MRPTGPDGVGECASCAVVNCVAGRGVCVDGFRGVCAGGAVEGIRAGWVTTLKMRDSFRLPARAEVWRYGRIRCPMVSALASARFRRGWGPTARAPACAMTLHIGQDRSALLLRPSHPLFLSPSPLSLLLPSFQWRCWGRATTTPTQLDRSPTCATALAGAPAPPCTPPGACAAACVLWRQWKLAGWLAAWWLASRRGPAGRTRGDE